MEDSKRSDRSKPAPAEPGAARLYGLVAGALLCLLGVAGFFYDASFDSGSSLSSDYLAGTLLVNGWRNLLYMLTGLLALALAGRAPRPTAFALGGFYLALAIWGLIETERGIGSILDILPLGDRDNVFHLVLGILGLSAGLVDGPRPKVKLPKRARKRKPKSRRAKPKPISKVEPSAKPKPQPPSKPKRPTSSSSSSSSSSA